MWILILTFLYTSQSFISYLLLYTGCGGIFASSKNSMCWLQSNLQKSMQKEPMEQLAVKALLEESLFLENELQKERNANNSLQSNIAHCRVQNDEMCALLSMVRSETDAVLNRCVVANYNIVVVVVVIPWNKIVHLLTHTPLCFACRGRHNFLLDTPEARAVAKDIYSFQHRLGYKRYHSDSSGGGGADLSLSHAPEMAHDNNNNTTNHHDDDESSLISGEGGGAATSSTRTSIRQDDAEEEDLDHDGDDEGDDDEYDIKEGGDEIFDV